MPDYDDAKIATNFKFDMDKITDVYTEYTVAEGREEGYKSHDYTYTSENTAGTGGTPGTDANDETDYQIQTSGNTGGTVNIAENDYTPNQRITNTEKAMGTLKNDESSIAINLIDYVTYNEDTMKKNGQLEGTDFDTFMLQNASPTAITVSEDVLNSISNAT